ncbi:MAG: hypothetical protein JWO20_2082 [Candidatus Angelobacter sp.]|jgi:hypothetical protein|nr:hypothetical protein [Candidatus Angelobacter sp.]
MSPIATSLLVFVCVFGGALFGMLLRSRLPEHHLSAESQRIVNLGAGIIGTMAALVLGLLVASAKGSYDAQSDEMMDFSSRIVLLDRVLAHYGPEAKDARDLLRDVVARMVDRMWVERSGYSESKRIVTGGEVMYDKIQELSPRDEAQRLIKTQALNLVLALSQTRWLMFEQRGRSISAPLLMMLVFWLTINFVSFGLFAPRNGTVITTLLLCAVAVSGAIFLILEMYEPYTGLIHISSAPARSALEQLGR